MNTVGIDLVFRCASADADMTQMAALRGLRDVAIDDGTVHRATPGGGEVVSLSSLEFLLGCENLRDVGALAAVAAAYADIRQDERRTMGSGDLPRLPALKASNPTTPARLPVEKDDEILCASTLPPITTIHSQPYVYQPKPTGEGLVRLFSHLNLCPQRVTFGLDCLHAAVMDLKRMQPHRLVKMPSNCILIARTVQLPLIAHTATRAHLDVATTDLPQRRLNTAQRIYRKLDDLKEQVQQLQNIRAIRHIHHRAPYTDAVRSVKMEKASLPTEVEPNNAAPLVNRRRVAPTTKQTASAHVADVIRSSRVRPMVAAAQPSDAPPANRAPVIPHRGLKASSVQNAVDNRKIAISETLM
jgi:hypothetical protein